VSEAKALPTAPLPMHETYQFLKHHKTNKTSQKRPGIDGPYKQWTSAFRGYLINIDGANLKL